MTFKLIAIAVLGVLMLVVLLASRRSSRRRSRDGLPKQSRSGADTGNEAINPAVLAAVTLQSPHNHHGGFDASAHGGGIDGGGAH